MSVIRNVRSRCAAAGATVALGVSLAAAVVVAVPAPGASASPARTHVAATMAAVVKSGVFKAHLSMNEFSMTSGGMVLKVKVDAMTHVTLGGKAVALAALKAGDHVTVHGHEETGWISATSVVAGM